MVEIVEEISENRFELLLSWMIDLPTCNQTDNSVTTRWRILHFQALPQPIPHGRCRKDFFSSHIYLKRGLYLAPIDINSSDIIVGAHPWGEHGSPDYPRSRRHEFFNVACKTLGRCLNSVTVFTSSSSSAALCSSEFSWFFLDAGL